MTHPNEEHLRDLYATFARGDLGGFLASCTDDVSFTVRGNTPGSGTFARGEFPDWIVGVLGQTGGSFREDVLDVFANDDHALMLLHHEFERDGAHREYGAAHILELHDGLIAKWTEHPGSMREFEEAWGTQ